MEKKKGSGTVKSAGLLMYRNEGLEPEYFLVHPGGPFWAKKDAGAWSIPKGLFEEGETAFAAAKREVEEETGIRPEGPFLELSPVKQKSGKMIYAWGCPVDFNAAAITSNSFEMEWPPKSGKMKSFPEVDRAGWFTFGEASVKILPGQLPLLDELKNLLADVS